MIRYSEVVMDSAFPLNLRAHAACCLLEFLGYSFLVDYGYLNAEDIVESKGLGGDLPPYQEPAGDIPMEGKC